ncbi:MAG: hypothetical protein U0992_16810 [Planctomycetaceae bacterium]
MRGLNAAAEDVRPGIFDGAADFEQDLLPDAAQAGDRDQLPPPTETP